MEAEICIKTDRRMDAATCAAGASHSCAARWSRTPHSALADKMQLAGIDLDKNAIQRIECGKRFVTDIELRAFAAVFGVTADELLRDDPAEP